MHGLRCYLDGDNKVSDNDVLRMPGSVNWKAVVLEGLEKPYPVDWLIHPTGARMTPEGVAGVLGVTLGQPDATRSSPNANSSSAGSSRTGGRSFHEAEPFDVASFPDVLAAVEKVSGDRSADTYSIVASSFRSGLRLAQIRWAVDQRADLRERLGEQAEDDIARVYCKLADSQQAARGGQREPRRVSFADDVAREVHKLRVREAAKRQFDSEKIQPATAFEAGLLGEIMSRSDSIPYRVFGLIPSNAGTLVVAQRKTGKTTLMLNLTRSLITGETFLGTLGVRKVTGRVAIINFEVSASQIASWAREAGVPGDRLYLVNLRGTRNPLNDLEARARLAALLRTQEVESLIVDPFGRACGDTNQNDAGESARGSPRSTPSLAQKSARKT